MEGVDWLDDDLDSSDSKEEVDDDDDFPKPNQQHEAEEQRRRRHSLGQFSDNEEDETSYATQPPEVLRDDFEEDYPPTQAYESDEERFDQKEEEEDQAGTPPLFELNQLTPASDIDAARRKMRRQAAAPKFEDNDGRWIETRRPSTPTLFESQEQDQTKMDRTKKLSNSGRGFSWSADSFDPKNWFDSHPKHKHQFVEIMDLILRQAKVSGTLVIVPPTHSTADDYLFAWALVRDAQRFSREVSSIVQTIVVADAKEFLSSLINKYGAKSDIIQDVKQAADKLAVVEKSSVALQLLLRHKNRNPLFVFLDNCETVQSVYGKAFYEPAQVRYAEIKPQLDKNQQIYFRVVVHETEAPPVFRERERDIKVDPTDFVDK